MGAKNGGMGNICELLINVVMPNKPKVLTGLDQKVRGMVRRFCNPPTQSKIPPAERQTLTLRVKCVEHGKPNYLHIDVESSP